MQSNVILMRFSLFLLLISNNAQYMSLQNSLAEVFKTIFSNSSIIHQVHTIITVMVFAYLVLIGIDVVVLVRLILLSFSAVCLTF